MIYVPRTQTLREKYIKALLKLGETQQFDKCTIQVVVFSRKEGGYYFLGRSGSVRIGKNDLVSDPVSNKFKQKLLNGGRNDS